MIRLIDGGFTTGNFAKDLVPELLTKGGSLAEIVKERYVFGSCVLQAFV